jgi:biopolymer transport protein ExbD
MAGGARRRGMITDINVTPLVDIMLVLLIIFMLTANLIARQSLEVDLPKASQGTAPPASPLGILLLRDGTLRLGGAPVTPTGLRDAIRAAVAANPSVQAIIGADKSVSHGRVVWVLDLIKSQGVGSFAIQIDPAGTIAPDEAP